jgi:RimJ/RimL family protein N-acetyltransferase
MTAGIDKDQEENNMEIRKAAMEDLPELLRVYAAARELMKRTGNPTQWGEDRPSRETLEEDIRRGDLYLAEEEGRVVGGFAFPVGVDEAYERLEGQWLAEGPYGVIHRLASDGTARGMLARCVAFCETIEENIKVDTHQDNQIMQHLLEKHGFRPCGTILAEDGSPRIAYQRPPKG